VDWKFAATAFATAFTIIDPVGMIPLSLGATAGSAPQMRARIIDRAIVVAMGVIAFMGLVGKSMLDYLGITLPAFMIAGGILLLLISIDMLFARKTGTKQTDEEEQAAAEMENTAVFPLAVPMIAGPGTIATVLLLTSLAHGDGGKIAVVYGAFAVALFVTWLCMRGATFLLRVVGNTGIHVITRLLGIILAALAVQFMLNGLAESPLVRRSL
jgi:multiple antibiotic resistance protein